MMSDWGIDIDGIDETIESLEELSERAEDLHGENQVPLLELYNPGFMKRYTKFEDIEAFFGASPWDVETDEDIFDIPEEEMDSYVDGHTEFDDSEEMMNAASKDWVAKQLGL